MRDFEVQGEWWLPGHGDNQVPGVLSWDSREGGALKLVGQLWPIVLLENRLPDGTVQQYRDRVHSEDRTYPVILGEVEGHAYTLLGSFQRSLREWSLERSTESVHVNAVLEGAWFEGPDMGVHRALFWVRDLAEWIDLTGLDISHPRFDRSGEEFAVVTAQSQPTIAIPTSRHPLELVHHLGTSTRGNRELALKQDWVVRVGNDEAAPFTDFVEVASDLQDLVSIATGRPAEFMKVVLHHSDVPMLSVGGTPLGQALEDLTYHARWTARNDEDRVGPSAGEPRPMSVYEMRFSFQHLGAEGVGRWLSTAAQFRTELGRTMATRYAKDSYLEDNLLNVCAALESFDKHFRNVSKATYVDRVRACISLAGEPFARLISIDPDVWAISVKDLRHDLAHHRERFRTDGSVGSHIVYEQLFWLFVFCMLRAAEAPAAVFDSISGHQDLTGLETRAGATTA